MSGTVSSSRSFNAGYPAAGTPMAVPVFRASGATNVAVADGNYVGGQNPKLADAGNGSNVSGTDDLGGLTAGGLTALVQSPVSNVSSSDNIVNINFGFSFDVVVNTNDAGQGSLRQFVINANALANTGLAQRANAGVASAYSYTPASGVETAIFMIPNGVAQPGILATVANQLTGTAPSVRALITLASALPAITDANTAIDGLTQTNNVRVGGSASATSTDTNTGDLGTGNTVGTSRVALGKVNRPEIEISIPSGSTGITFSADNGVLRGVAAHGGAVSVRADGRALNFLLEQSLLGTDALTLAAAGTNATSNLNVELLNPTGIIRKNIIAYAGGSGLNYSGGQGTAGYSITQNEFLQNGRVTAGGDNITVGDHAAAGPVSITENLIRDSNSSGIQFEIAAISNNLVRENTISGNGKGGLSSRLEGSGIHYLLRTQGLTSTNTDVIGKNIITANQSSGVVLNYGQRNVQITQNSIFGNGDGTTGGQGLIAIDFTGPNFRVGGDAAYGQGDGVTPNDGTTDPSKPNGGMNYAIITKKSVSTSGTNTILHAEGFVGRNAGQANFAGTLIEFYRGDNDTDTNQNGEIFVGDRQSFPHGEPRDYIGAITTTTTGTFVADITIPTNSLSPALLTTDPINSISFQTGLGSSEAGINLIPNTIPKGALPVSLTGFSATCAAAGVQLAWHTASELNNKGFDVQRSLDGVAFESIAFQGGFGTTTQPHSYRLVVSAPTATTAYYRLRQVDYDGTETYSPITAATCVPAASAAALVLLPNPARGSVQLQGATEGPVQLLDLTGRVLRQQSGAEQPLNLAGVPAGSYIVRNGLRSARLQVE